MHCPYCGSYDVFPAGDLWECAECGEQFYEEEGYEDEGAWDAESDPESW